MGVVSGLLAGSSLPSQAARFLLAGGTAVSVDFASFALLRWLGLALVASNVVAFSLAFLTGFAINRRWTFAATSDAVGRQMARYGVTAAVGLVLNSAVLLALVAAGAPELVAKAVATGFSAAVNFVMSRAWVFKASSTAGQPGSGGG